MNEITNEKVAQEILHELFPAFEALETQRQPFCICKPSATPPRPCISLREMRVL
jgi:hypothetical protein